MKIRLFFPALTLLFILILNGCSTTSNLPTEPTATDSSTELNTDEITVDEEISPTEDWHLLTPSANPFYRYRCRISVSRFISR